MVQPATLTEYYCDPHVRARILEYCGAPAGQEPGAVYLAAMSASESPFITWENAPRHAPDRLDVLMGAGADIARSMWDRESLLVHVDFDYLNVDSPAESYIRPAEVFHKIEPGYRAARHVFSRHGLVLLPLVTGRGYHFSGRVPLSSEVVDELADLVPAPPPWLASLDDRRPEWPTPALSERHARAYAGAGMLVEYLAHQILRRARPRSPIPIVLNNTVVGTGEVGRECLSIDLSYAGDPMDVRHMRVAFGAYQKHRFRPDLSGPAASHPPMIAVPRGDEPVAHMLSHRSDLRHAARLARGTTTTLPECSNGVARALDSYRRSPLGHFHREFMRSMPATRAASANAPRPAVRRAGLPACVTRPLAVPNDLLLQPAIVQHVTRVLMAEGLPPRDIAALIRSRYDADYGWGRRWNWMDPETRACFDVRVFSGMVVAGVDAAIDLNCRSAQEKGLCPGGDCGLDLRAARARLVEGVQP